MGETFVLLIVALDKARKIKNTEVTQIKNTEVTQNND